MLSSLTTHGLAQLLGHSFEVPEGNLPGLIIVKQVEYLLNVLPRVLVALRRGEGSQCHDDGACLEEQKGQCSYHLGSHHVQELIKVYSSAAIFVNVCYHLVDGLIFRFEAQ